MANEDYQLEELENESVKKSNNAKRIAAAAGLLAGGGAAGFAATKIPFGTDAAPVDSLTEDDLEEVADTGANQVHEQEAVLQPAQPAPQPATPVQPTTPADDGDDVSFDKTTHYYDDDNNLLLTKEEGTIDGHNFMLADVDGDMRADVLAYDQDGNGDYNSDEFVALEGENQIAMGHPTAQHEDEFLAINNDTEPIVDPEPYDINEEKDFSDNDIHNDFEDEKTGENYSHDYAEDNEDYNNNGNVEPYTADNSEETDYSYEEATKEENVYANEEGANDDGDYEDNDLAENDTSDDSFDDFGSDDIDLV